MCLPTSAVGGRVVRDPRWSGYHTFRITVGTTRVGDMVGVEEPPARQAGLIEPARVITHVLEQYRTVHEGSTVNPMIRAHARSGLDAVPASRYTSHCYLHREVGA